MSIFLNDREFFDFLVSKNLDPYYDNGKKEIICKCYKCEINTTQKRHYHFYISTGTPVYNCFKCEDVRGNTKSLILDLGGNPDKYLTKEALENKYISGYKYHASNFITNNKLTHEPEALNITDQFKDKLEYLKSRIVNPIQNEYMKSFIFDFNTFFKNNPNIILNKYDQDNIDMYTENYIGVVTNRNTQIILRNIRDNGDFKHRKIFINPTGYFKDFYGLKISNIKLGINTIILCEGVYDLLVGLHSPELEEIKNRSVYGAAILGKSYKNTIISVLDYLKLPCANFIILSDKDVNKRKYTKLLLHPMVKQLEIYYNLKSKDFGNYSDGIDPIKVDLKLKNVKRQRTNY